MKRQESFPISEELVKEFIELNKLTFAGEDIKKSEKYIYINFSMVRMQIGWITSKLTFAKGLQEKTGCEVICLTWKDNKLLSDYFASYGFKHIVLDDECSKAPFSGISAFLKTAKLVLFSKDIDALLKFRLFGVNIGKDIYEDILRTSNLSTLRTCKNKILFKKMFHIVWTLTALKKITDKYPAAYIIGDDMGYHEGAFLKMFRYFGAKIKCCNNYGYEEVYFLENGDIKKRMLIAREDYQELVKNVTDDEYEKSKTLIADRFAGRNGRNIDKGAFVGKKVLDKQEMIDLLGIDPSKKTVAIMAHTFTDAVFNYGSYYFRDYYDWLDKTLELAETITDVNWILKPHPTRSAYNESEDSIEDMFARHKKSHIFWVSDEISSESMKNVSDLVVTIGGNAGAEYACFGIPAIIVGKPWYSGFGITIEPKTYDEYKKTLEDAKNINKLNDEQIVTAYKLFYVRNTDNRSLECYKDELASLMNEKYGAMMDKMAISYFLSNDGTREYNDESLKALMSFMSGHDIRKTMYYETGYNSKL